MDGTFLLRRFVALQRVADSSMGDEISDYKKFAIPAPRMRMEL